MNDPSDLLVASSVENNLLQRVQDLERQLALAQRSSVEPETLDQLCGDLGLMTQGEFRCGNGVDPGDGFSGVRMGYPGFEYNNQTWHLVGVNNDALQFGLDALTGIAYCGAGAAWGDVNGWAVLPSTVDGTYLPDRAYKVKSAVDGVDLVALWGKDYGSIVGGYLEQFAQDGRDGFVSIGANAPSGQHAQVQLQATANSISAVLSLAVDNAGNKLLSLNGDNLEADFACTFRCWDLYAEGKVIVGSSLGASPSNTKNSMGVTIFQAGYDDEILSMKSSDIDHGATGVTETDTYGFFAKVNATNGGLWLEGISKATAAFYLAGVETNDITTKSTNSLGVCNIRGQKKSGTGVGDLGANANIVAVLNNGTTRFILDGDGDSHQDVGTAWTNFDDQDDVHLLTALSATVAPTDDPLRKSFRGMLERSRREVEAVKLAQFNKNGHHFVNMSRLQMVTVGAVRQQDGRLNGIEQRLAALERRLLGTGA